MDRSRPGYSITEAADASGLTVRALRYYETLGLLTPDRTPGRARLYSSQLLGRVRAIADLRNAGIDLPEIVAAFQADSAVTTKDRLRVTIAGRLQELEQQRRKLDDLAASLEGGPDLVPVSISEIPTRGRPSDNV